MSSERTLTPAEKTALTNAMHELNSTENKSSEIRLLTREQKEAINQAAIEHLEQVKNLAALNLTRQQLQQYEKEHQRQLQQNQDAKDAETLKAAYQAREKAFAPLPSSDSKPGSWEHIFKDPHRHGRPWQAAGKYLIRLSDSLIHGIRLEIFDTLTRKFTVDDKWIIKPYVEIKFSYIENSDHYLFTIIDNREVGFYNLKTQQRITIQRIEYNPPYSDCHFYGFNNCIYTLYRTYSSVELRIFNPEFQNNNIRKTIFNCDSKIQPPHKISHISNAVFINPSQIQIAYEYYPRPITLDTISCISTFDLDEKSFELTESKHPPTPIKPSKKSDKNSIDTFEDCHFFMNSKEMLTMNNHLTNEDKIIVSSSLSALRSTFISQLLISRDGEIRAVDNNGSIFSCSILAQEYKAYSKKCFTQLFPRHALTSNTYDLVLDYVGSFYPIKRPLDIPLFIPDSLSVSIYDYYSNICKKTEKDAKKHYIESLMHKLGEDTFSSYQKCVAEVYKSHSSAYSSYSLFSKVKKLGAAISALDKTHPRWKPGGV